MTKEEKAHRLGSMPPPGSPHEKPKGFWKKPFAIVIALIGVTASTYTVVGMLQGWFDPAPTAEELAAESVEKLGQLEQKLTAKEEDKHLVNQVSRRVTELGDQFKRILVKMKDIRRLDRSLSGQAVAKKILTPEQEKLRQASRKQETEELLALVAAAEKMASDFVTSVKQDATLDQVASSDSETAKTKARALQQSGQVESKFLPELKQLREKYAD